MLRQSPIVMCSDGMPVLKIRQLIKNGLIFFIVFFYQLKQLVKLRKFCEYATSGAR